MTENICTRFQSRRRERTKNGTKTTLIYSGTYEAILQLQNELPPDFVDANMGQVVSSVMTQETPKIWHLEVLYTTDTEGELSIRPKKKPGDKEHELSGGVLSLPLESAPGYLTCWNHYLFAAPEAKGAKPAFFASAKDTVIAGANAVIYAWGKSLSDLPQGWSVVGTPIKPGVTSRDKATYSITEKIYCQTDTAAGSVVANKLNKIGSPSKKFGISNGGNWKCDDAQVTWDGNYWVAHLTWTLSGDAKGWDKDLYTD